jgi:hypothetical protein
MPCYNAGMDLLTFSNRWRNSTLTERSAAQSYFNDLCTVLGFETPTAADQSGETYTFERGAKKTGGGDGWADVWYRGHFAWEFKGKHANLDKAYQQLRRYAEDLENPPLLVVSDFDSIIIRTNFTNTPTETHRIDLDGIADPDNLAKLRALWEDPERLRPAITIDEVTTQAAHELGKITLALRDRGVEAHRAAHFTVELLFCFFAEDIGLLPRGLFRRLLELGTRAPDQFTTQLQELLQKMQTGGVFGVEPIAYFNGGLFAEIVVEPLTREEIRRLATIADLDWGAVEPAIFGTLFERSLDPARRSQLGAHYTGAGDIERVVEPVVMAPLRRRWEDVRTEADRVSAEWAEARRRLVGTRAQQRGGVTQQINAAEVAFRKLIDGYLSELRSVTILDPACGSGNFLYVALRKLMDLEKAVITYAANQGLSAMFPEVSPRQVFGLEINEYAVEITQTVIWIGYLQWRLGNGFGVGTPILEPLDTIREQDALLDLSDSVHPKEATWPAAEFIIGNPPFLGDKKMRRELGDQYVSSLRTIFASRLPGTSNLCCYFFEKARSEIERSRCTRAGLLATQAITRSTNRRVLEHIRETGDIFLGWSDEQWVLDGANLHISIIGFDDGSESQRILNGQPVDRINQDLTSNLDLTPATPLQENAGLSFIGVQPTGNFDIPKELAERWISLPLNPNGRSNRDVLKKFANARDILQCSRERWIIDFGTQMAEPEACLYEAPFEYLVEHVKPNREENRRERTRAQWWIHAEARPGMRFALSGLPRYIATGIVAKHRIFVWLEADWLAGNKCAVIARSDDYCFGLLHSRVHLVWAHRMAAKHGGERPAYQPILCFESFPFPWSPGAEPVDDPLVQEIAAAAKELDERRRAWLDPPGASEADLKKRTLTNLYNERPTWLQYLHDRLDRAVWAAYGWGDENPGTVSEETILERLLALNLARASKTA